MLSTADVSEGLRALVAAEQPGATGIEVSGLHRTTGGQSKENWPFDLSWIDTDGSHTEPLILRRDPIASVLETERRIEHGVLRAIEADPTIPAPRSRWIDADGGHLGRPSIVMERCDGVCDHFVLEGGSLQLPLESRLQLASRYCEIMASIHRFDWRGAGLGDLFDTPTQPAVDAIDHWTGVLAKQAAEPHPELAEIERWLREHAPAPQAITLVHGDLKPGNSLLERTDRGWDVQVMLDWETAHLGDPLEDVGWVTNPLRQREHQIPGSWTRTELVARYESSTGFRVDPDALHFWNVLANYKLVTILLTGVRAFIDGVGERAWPCSRSLAGFLLRQIEAAP